MKLKLRPGALPEGMTLTHPAAIVASWFWVGFMPMASGTWGSLAALPLAWFVDRAFGAAGLLVAAAALTAAGIWAANVVVTRGPVRDPGLIVIDEVAGMTLALAFAPPTWWGYALAFVFFRLADIFKPFPADWCDRNVHGGIGVMLDDLVAAVYAGLSTWLFVYLGLADHVGRFFTG